jgi:hypothetical protein
MKKNNFKFRVLFGSILFVVGATLAVAALTIELVPGTAVLLSQSSTSSGNGGNTSSTSTMTNIFSPPTFVDYKRIGTEPVVAVDRYPITSGMYNGKTCTQLSPCYSDIVYVDSTEGFGYPRYDFFWKSENLGQSFRLPHNDPTVGGKAMFQGQGGGDGHHDIGQLTHSVFFIDLAFTHVTMNVSRDRGETFVGDETGSGTFFADDRQWVASDELMTGSSATPSAGGYSCLTATPQPTCGNVYTNFANILESTFAPTIVLTRSTKDGAPGSFVTDSVCNAVTAAEDNPTPFVTGPAADGTPTRCPDPVDPVYSVTGPVVVDRTTVASTSAHPHRLYIPFLRCSPTDEFQGFTDCGPPYRLYIAYSDDGGTSWLRRPLCNGATGPCLGLTDNPRNIFVQMTIDRAGNLYYTWAQKPFAFDTEDNDLGGESDIYYAFSTDGGVTWSQAINLTKETGDSAVWPWMVAGDPGQVDLVYYKANNGDDPPNARPGTVWNVYFAQSQNALNTGPNFKSVQISDHPNHIGPICLSGLGCDSGRTLGDFFTMDIDHLGAANVVWADDNNPFNATAIKFSRQLSGNSAFKNTNINLVSSWPIKDHTAYDLVPGDVITPTSFPGTSPSCTSMDIQQMNASRSGDLLTITLTLTAPPSGANAALCAGTGLSVANGGFWGGEWWSSDSPNDHFYIAYVDAPSRGPRVEAGRFDSVSVPSLIANEPQFVENGTLGGTCLTSAGVPNTAAPTPCTITMTASLTGLDVKSGAGLYSLTGLSLYITGNTSDAPLGYTSLGDATPAIDYTGTGTTSK